MREIGIEQRGKAANGGCPHQTTTSEDAMGFAQSSEPFVSFGKVIKRSQQ